MKPQTPRDETGTSPPLETDPRARRCEVHDLLLYPGELCLYCLQNNDNVPGDTYMPEWIRKREVQRPEGEPKKVIPGILRCECKAEVTISHDGVACPSCGQPYNLFGQRLRRDWQTNPYEE